MRRDELEALHAKVSELRAEQNKEQTVRPANEEAREGIRGTSLENAPDVGQEFERTRDIPTHGASMEPDTGSEQGKGQTVRPANEEAREGIRGTSLENAPDVGQEFERAQAVPTQGASMEPGIGSEQVKGSGQKNNIAPPIETGPAVDREQHTKAMANDRERANQAKLEAFQEMKSAYSQDIEKDQGREMGYEIG